MNRVVKFALCLVALGFARPCVAAPNEAVTADKSAVAPGEKVTLHWYFTGKKVVVAGGRFGKGVVVTGRTSLVDAPTKPTTYSFDVWYSGKAPAADGSTTVKPLHAQYHVKVDVLNMQGRRLVTYADQRGWSVNYISGWHIDKVNTNAGGPNALLYFQPEDDSIDRLVVAREKADGLTCAGLMDKVQSLIVSVYQDVSILSKEQCTHEGCEAVTATWEGADPAHDGAKTMSVVLVFVEGDDAYVVSARTTATRFPSQHALMERLVRSFAFTKHAVTQNRDLSLLR